MTATCFTLMLGIGVSLLSGCVSTADSGSEPHVDQARDIATARDRSIAGQDILAPSEKCVPKASNAALEREHLMLAADYYDLGHVRAEVEPPVLREDKACFTVHPGNRYRIGSAHIADLDPQPGDSLGDPAALSALFHLRAGDWFSRRAIVSDLQSIRTRYRDAGYYGIEVDPETTTDDRTLQIAIDVSIRRGPIATIERIDVAGNHRISESVIRNALLVKSGERYHGSRADETTNRLMALGVFRDVELKFEPLNGHYDRLTLTVEVREKE